MTQQQEIKRPHDLGSVEIQRYVYDWLRWCETRRFYLAPAAKNVLARFQPSRSGREPDARNSADMQWFNAAVHTLAEMAKHREDYLAWQVFYIEQPRHIKRVADGLGIGRATIYRRRDNFTRAAISMARSLEAAHAKMAAQENQSMATTD